MPGGFFGYLFGAYLLLVLLWDKFCDWIYDLIFGPSVEDD